MKYVLLIVSVFLLCACSNQSIYNSIQYNHQQECKKLLSTQPRDQYEECIDRHKGTYNEYTRKRIEGK